MSPSCRWAQTLRKSAALLSIAALATVQNRAVAASFPIGNRIELEQVVPPALARDELLTRAISCENMQCLERELDDELIPLCA